MNISRGGIRCPKCVSYGLVSVTDTRVEKGERVALDATKRRKRCSCGHTWVTFEIHQETYKLIRKVFASAKPKPPSKKRREERSPTTREELLRSIQEIEGKSR